MPSKIYSVKYTDQALPKSRDPITVTVGKLRSVRVPFLTEGYITRIVVKQTDGTSCECLVDLLDSSVPYPAGEYDAGSSPADDIELYRIIEAQTVPAGGSLVIINQEFGYPFHNQDGTFTDNQRYIYLILQPLAAADTTTWEVAMTGHNEVG